MRFWDTSALLPLVKDESQTDAIRAIQAEDEDIVVWWATRVECVSALTRRLREGTVSPAEEVFIREALHDLFETATEIMPSEDVRARSERALAVHPLRAADALQLGAGLVWARDRTRGREFVSLDGRLREAAQREGFTVLPA